MFNRLGCGNASAVVNQAQVPVAGGDGSQQGAQQQQAAPAAPGPAPAPAGPASTLPSPPMVAPAQGAQDGRQQRNRQAALQAAAALGIVPPPPASPPSPGAPGSPASPGSGGTPLVVPQFQIGAPGVAPQDRNNVNYLLAVLFNLIEEGGVPRSLQAVFPPPPGAGSPNPLLVLATQVLMNQRMPMMILALLRNLWPGGISYQHVPDGWILSRLWNIIREYDSQHTNLSHHLRPEHEVPGNLPDGSFLNRAHACTCWADRLGQGWDTRTRAQDIALMPPGCVLEPPDKLKRMLTAVLDDYVKSNTNSLRRNPWILNRRQPYTWAAWMKPFARSFLQLQGLDNFVQGQYWYLVDGDATVLGQLSGYQMDDIHMALIKWRRRVLQPLVAPPQPPPLPPPPPPPPPVIVPPAIPNKRGARLGTPDDYFLLDQFLLPHILRNNTHTPKFIPKAQRDAFWQRTQNLQNITPHQKIALLSGWYKPAVKSPIRGTNLIRVGQNHYDMRANQNGAPRLDQCWQGKAVINEQWFQEALTMAIQEADKVRRATIQREAVAAAWAGRPAPVRAPAPVAHPQDEVFAPLGPPLTYEEIYLLVTAISETQLADQLNSDAMLVVLQELRSPAVIARITQRIHMTVYPPPNNISQPEMDFGLWRFELPQPPPQGWWAGINPPPPPGAPGPPSPPSPPPSRSPPRSPPRNYPPPAPPSPPASPPQSRNPSPPQNYQLQYGSAPPSPPRAYSPLPQTRSPSPPQNYQLPYASAPSSPPRAYSPPPRTRSPSPPYNYQLPYGSLSPSPPPPNRSPSPPPWPSWIPPMNMSPSPPPWSWQPSPPRSCSPMQYPSPSAAWPYTPGVQTVQQYRSPSPPPGNITGTLVSGSAPASSSRTWSLVLSPGPFQARASSGSPPSPPSPPPGPAPQSSSSHGSNSSPHGDPFRGFGHVWPLRAALRRVPNQPLESSDSESNDDPVMMQPKNKPIKVHRGMRGQIYAASAQGLNIVSPPVAQQTLQLQQSPPRPQLQIQPVVINPAQPQQRLKQLARNKNQAKRPPGP